MVMRALKFLASPVGKRIIVRCDLNVPMSDGRITDDGRLRAALPTLTRLIREKARVVVVSHLGRPHGIDPSYTLAPVAERLSELLKHPVAFLPETIGPSVEKMVDKLHESDVVVLENLRFHPEETSTDTNERKTFAGHIARFGDVLISDGFGVMHRKQASVYELAQLLPSCMGFLVERELTVLQQLTESPQRPYTVVLGGSKVSDKLGVIDHLLPRVDSLLIGGGMMFTFLAAQGYPVGASLLEKEHIETAKTYLEKAEKLGVNIVLPRDVVVASEFSPHAEYDICAADAIENSRFGSKSIGLDIGPQTAQAFAEIIRASHTVFWNGPMGVFEFPSFAEGTRVIADALVSVKGLSVVGGGDSAAAIRALNFRDDQFTHVSTGGGASLEFLEGKTLPGLEVLQDPEVSEVSEVSS